MSLNAGNFGLIRLQEPDEAIEVKATIIAVHGLSGHYLHTWTNTNVDPPFLWLRDGLGIDLPNCRVFSYGYDATSNFRFGEILSTSMFNNHVESLHAHLRLYLLSEPNSRPIIFIAHNLGGVLVNFSLIVVIWDPQFIHARLLSCFLAGTPHHGSDTTAFASMINSILSLSTGLETKTSLDNATAKDSKFLQMANEWWFHMAHEYKIYSYYETRATVLAGQSRMIVNKHEAVLNLPQERVMALDASHSYMVKPPSRLSSKYQLVLGCLREIIQGLRPTARPPMSPIPETGLPQLDAPKNLDIQGFIHLFKNNLIEEVKQCSMSDMMSKSPRTIMSDRRGPRDKEEEQLLTWVHCPLNNTSWVNPCLLNTISDHRKGSVLPIMQQKYWLSNERRRQDIPHSRYFEPSCFAEEVDNVIQFVIYLPYMHWDSVERFKERAKFFKEAQAGRRGASLSHISEEGKAIYQIMMDDRANSSLHPRRSLDQFFYSSLPDTSSRDDDQIVSKRITEGARGGKKMVMVDQLWLWCLETWTPHSGSSIDNCTIRETSIFTSFPRKEKEARAEAKDLEDIADLRQAIIDEGNSKADTPESNLLFVALIVEQAVNVMLRVRTEASLDFFDVFRAAIGEASEQQTEFFRKFQERLKSDPGSISNSEVKRAEVKLALEVSDMIDELHSMNRLFEVQADVLQTATKVIRNIAKKLGKTDQSGPNSYLELYHRFNAILKQDIPGYKIQVKRMMADAQRTKDSLKDLLDLQQKEETLQEAQLSREQVEAAQEQADATEAQSKILFLFTIVTIFFAPLSFFTSYYGMNVREFTGEPGNTNQRAVWTFMGPLSAAIIIGLLGGAWYMYKETQEKQRKRKAEARAKKKADKAAGKGK